MLQLVVLFCRHCVIAFDRPSRVRCAVVVVGRAVSCGVELFRVEGGVRAARCSVVMHRDIVGHKLKYVSARVHRPEAGSCLLL